MTRILIFSDSHGETEYIENAIERIIGVDYIIHAGDNVKDAREIEILYPEIKHIYVSGNCDFFDPEPTEKTLSIDGKTFFVSHGHRFGVKTGLENLKRYCTENSVDCAIFGHTHIPCCVKENGSLLINPGSPESDAGVGVIEIENDNINGCIIK